MPVLWIIVGVVAGVVFFVVGVAWVLIFAAPFYGIFVAVVLYIFHQRRRRQQMVRADTDEAKRQRQFNEQEYAAWQAAIDDKKRLADRRETALRKFDNS